MTRMIDADVLVDAGASLGESPVWDGANGRLLWVDINPGVVHDLDVESGEDRPIEVGPTVGAVALRRDGSRRARPQPRVRPGWREDGTVTDLGRRARPAGTGTG